MAVQTILTPEDIDNKTIVFNSDNKLSRIPSTYTLTSAGRIYLYSNERWISVTDDNYGNQYVNAEEDAGTGVAPIIEWENRGDYIRAETHIHELTVTGRINSDADHEDLILAAYFVSPIDSIDWNVVGVDSDAKMQAVELGRLNWMQGDANNPTIEGAINHLYRRTLIINFTTPTDGEIRLFYKPVKKVGGGASTRYFIHTNSWLLSHTPKTNT